ncbi:hypothetical protein GCK32_003082 [Trichostrongylus colubriformis]|uniref:Secreted protein n=1 Tax=Trichostrongylus colubriformis TaxID=6319 RepID=A0AAN8F1H2_TRICO
MTSSRSLVPLAVLFTTFSPSLAFLCCIEWCPGSTTTTTERPPYEKQNIFQRAGWETDDEGNVFIGNDNCKFFLISVGKFWPFPKDYRKK